MSLAAVHTVPNAIRLGSRTDTIAGQSQSRDSILRDHLLCILAVAGVLFVQLAFAEVMDGQRRIGNTGRADPGLRGGRMADKSPHFSKDKKKGKTLQEKRAAKRQKRSERRSADEARNRAEGI